MPQPPFPLLDAGAQRVDLDTARSDCSLGRTRAARRPSAVHGGAPYPGQSWASQTVNHRTEPPAEEVAATVRILFAITERLLLEELDGVDHSGYWTRPSFCEKLLSWLA